MEKTRVVLAEDHPLVRTGIRNILHKDPQIIVVGEAEDGVKALELVDDLEPDVLLLDIEMPGMMGTQVLEEISKSGTDVSVLALSSYDDRQFIMSMLRNGAAGYLIKDEAPKMILKAVHGVSAGEYGWVSRKVAARLLAWLLSEDPDRYQDIAIHTDILPLAAAGKSDSEIAVICQLDPGEVRRDMERVIQTVKSFFRSGSGKRKTRKWS